MAQNKKGFTLIELMAVIVIMSVVITIAATSTISIMNRTKQQTTKEMQQNLQDAAISYVLANVHLKKCSVSFSSEMLAKNLAHLSSNSDCAKQITVNTLINEGFFEDKKGYCKKEDSVVVYRSVDSQQNSEYKSYVDEKVCTNY